MNVKSNFLLEFVFNTSATCPSSLTFTTPPLNENDDAVPTTAVPIKTPSISISTLEYSNPSFGVGCKL